MKNYSQKTNKRLTRYRTSSTFRGNVKFNKPIQQSNINAAERHLASRDKFKTQNLWNTNTKAKNFPKAK